jgi:hypothetical protein
MELSKSKDELLELAHFLLLEPIKQVIFWIFVIFVSTI